MDTPYQTSATEDTIHFVLPAYLPPEELPAALAALVAQLRPPIRHVHMDLSTPTPPPDTVVVLAEHLSRTAKAQGLQVVCSEPLESALCSLAASPQEGVTLLREHFFARFGRKTVEVLRTSLDHAAFLGTVTMSLLAVLRRPWLLRGRDTVTAMARVGVDAVPIVGLIGFLLGLIMAFMSAVQLAQFGATIYVASLVALAMVRELGPIMTAILVAGRSGSAFAAEIGTMRVSEEIDALITMGFDPIRFLVLPKLVAATVVVPILTLYANVFAIAGGLTVGVLLLDLTPMAYMQQTLRTLTLFDVLWGFFKSGLFGLLIVLVGCHRGFAVRGGAESVGHATTSAVVTSIFLIIFVDSVLAVILRYWR